MKKNSAVRIATIGIMSALATGLMFLEFPIFPSVNFLKFDPSDILPLLAGFIFGPIDGILVLLIKDILFFLLKSGDIVGIAMNFAAGASFLLPAIYIYRIRENRAFEIIGYVVGVVVVAGVMTVLNMIVVPLYWKIPLQETLKYLPIIAAFNAIKFSIDAVVTSLIRERIARIFEN
ncbi:Riboflavin transporter FmnP [Fervidobacterium changbaicum]|uniref:Riboflavin transporter n=1 Tax=Fervidobacterium changbaicum TaxID=310769 RepID=A0ABX5QTP4_9BACT|nr:ECF transporter S component [Fervidobacterium changbaicum]QAV33746.1 ECF transporter S component [Fervidobacterium changbaicum]SDH31632.1 Riboflavin transporter FmnP [Fervidobacterium changbaicum]